MQTPEIIDAPERLFVGMRITTCHAENRTFELWRGFKPRVREIAARLDANFISVQIFAAGQNFAEFTPQTIYEKWAAVEVDEPAEIPDGMELLTIPAGKYAVFVHRGLPQDFPKTNAFIHGVWMPASPFRLDARPHFEVMAPDYRADDPDAQEAVWVPVRFVADSD